LSAHSDRERAEDLASDIDPEAASLLPEGPDPTALGPTSTDSPIQPDGRPAPAEDDEPGEPVRGGP
jgi:hypothetical protein